MNYDDSVVTVRWPRGMSDQDFVQDVLSCRLHANSHLFNRNSCLMHWFLKQSGIRAYRSYSLHWDTHFPTLKIRIQIITFSLVTFKNSRKGKWGLEVGLDREGEVIEPNTLWGCDGDSFLQMRRCIRPEMPRKLWFYSQKLYHLDFCILLNWRLLP